MWLTTLEPVKSVGFSQMISRVVSAVDFFEQNPSLKVFSLINLEPVKAQSLLSFAFKAAAVELYVHNNTLL